MLKFYHSYKDYYKSILSLSYPIIVGQLGIVLMGVADVIMVGKVSAQDLAAVAFANSIYFFVSILGLGTLSAIAPLVAKARGAQKPNECAILFRQGINAALILSVFIYAVIFFFTLNLHWFGQEKVVADKAKDFLHIINVSNLFMLLFLAAKQYSDGLALTKSSAIITIAALLLNVFGNWLLIHGNWGFPKLGINGAAIATLVSRFLMAATMIVYVLTNHLYKPYLRLKERIGGRILLKEIFRVGLPSGFQYTFEMGAFATAAIMIGWFGAYPLAAHQVAINIASVTYMIATGISAGGSIAVGNALGRKNKADLMKAGRAALIMGAVFMLGCAALFALFNSFIVGVYTNDKQVIEMAANLLLIAALFQLSDGVQCVALGVLRGISDTKVPTIITVIAYWIIGLPVGWWLAKSFNLGLYGIWFGLSIGLTFSAIFLSIRFLKESREFDFVAEEKEHYKNLTLKAD